MELSAAGRCALLCAGIAESDAKTAAQRVGGSVGVALGGAVVRSTMMQAVGPQRLSWRGRTSERGRVPARCSGDAQILCRKDLVRVVVVHGAVKWRLCSVRVSRTGSVVQGAGAGFVTGLGWAGQSVPSTRLPLNKAKDARAHNAEHLGQLYRPLLVCRYIFQWHGLDGGCTARVTTNLHIRNGSGIACRNYRSASARFECLKRIYILH
ncbi:uncharacterized protein CC84DRAFT_59843 [Paraphaeosphaeria sporulosa]|uniref:Uncharacterized protein n=1 Tax=Paraphaeosphaeria sporulosa TaxID=1460663 RepID=A0A177CYK0_9PLEO|nr:uncharacterized protein CC84DRAFT_59843 [Paraphaeosphaeria sporulosa]OAG11900.1 hypothetical protein CC84DRAFT_59843 [Paraphaeosphaeria sporulosa]